MTRSYEFYKAKWHETKPIRGRSVDVRPIDKYRRYRDWETDRKSTRLNSSHSRASRMPSSA